MVPCHCADNLDLNMSYLINRTYVYMYMYMYVVGLSDFAQPICHHVEL